MRRYAALQKNKRPEPFIRTDSTTPPDRRPVE
jgi:hypothetical protein